MRVRNLVHVAGVWVASSLAACTSNDGAGHDPKAEEAPEAPITAGGGGQGGAASGAGASSTSAGGGGGGGSGGGVAGAATGDTGAEGGAPDGGQPEETAGGGAAGSSGSEMTDTGEHDPTSTGGDSGVEGSEGRSFSIRFDYRFDTAGFFDPPERRAALEAAGAIWSRYIEDDFSTVPAGTALRLRNPENRDEYVWVDGIEEDIDDLLVFVGSSAAIPGLGRGGASTGVETSDSTLLAELSARVSGTDYEPWAGSISFNPTYDFFFDPTPETGDDVPFEQYDFISNALHELGHVLGFMASHPAFESSLEGGFFVGPVAQDAYGGPVPLTEGLGHFPNGTTLDDGVEALMDEAQANGTRVLPTRLDLAVLADIGYEIAP